MYEINKNILDLVQLIIEFGLFSQNFKRIKISVLENLLSILKKNRHFYSKSFKRCNYMWCYTTPKNVVYLLFFFHQFWILNQFLLAIFIFCMFSKATWWLCHAQFIRFHWYVYHFLIYLLFSHSIYNLWPISIIQSGVVGAYFVWFKIPIPINYTYIRFKAMQVVF